MVGEKARPSSATALPDDRFFTSFFNQHLHSALIDERLIKFRHDLAHKARRHGMHPSEEYGNPLAWRPGRDQDKECNMIKSSKSMQAHALACSVLYASSETNIGGPSEDHGARVNISKQSLGGSCGCHHHKGARSDKQMLLCLHGRVQLLCGCQTAPVAENTYSAPSNPRQLLPASDPGGLLNLVAQSAPHCGTLFPCPLVQRAAQGTLRIEAVMSLTAPRSPRQWLPNCYQIKIFAKVAREEKRCPFRPANSGSSYSLRIVMYACT